MKCNFQPISGICECSTCYRKVECEDCNRLDVECKSRGLGDTIAKITHAIGVHKCQGCTDRQKKLNDWFSY